MLWTLSVILFILLISAFKAGVPSNPWWPLLCGLLLARTLVTLIRKDLSQS